jgi:hypothetical protein
VNAASRKHRACRPGQRVILPCRDSCDSWNEHQKEESAGKASYLDDSLAALRSPARRSEETSSRKSPHLAPPQQLAEMNLPALLEYRYGRRVNSVGSDKPTDVAQLTQTKVNRQPRGEIGM